MPRATQAITNITAGELSPLVLGLVDQSRYYNSAEVLTNYLIRTQGPISNRPGLQFIAEAKDHFKRVRLIGFEFSTLQSYILEFGHEYLRFYMNKGQIISGLAPYEIVTPFTETQLRQIKYVQSADIMYLVHPAFWPRELSRRAHDSWQLQEMDLIDGPYLDENTTATTIQPSAVTGNVILTAVPAPGPEKVLNGNFVSELGSELVASGPWIMGAGWSVTIQGFLHTTGYTDLLSQSINISIGSYYRVSFSINSMINGSVTVTLGGTTGTARNANGTYIEYLTAIGTTGISFNPDVGGLFDGAILNISVIKLSSESAWIWGSHWSLDVVNQIATHAIGSIEALEQDIEVIPGKYYTIVFTGSNRINGSVTPYLGGVAGTARSTNGIFTETVMVTGTGNLQFVPSSDFDGSIDIISVKESALSVEIFKLGHVGSLWRLKHSTTWGYAKVTAFINKTQVNALVKKDFGGTGAVTAWREGAFSEYRGFPRAVQFYEERLFFAGTTHKPQTIWGSKSAEWTNFAPETTMTDAGPITYTIPSQSSGQINNIMWLAPGRTLLMGTMSEEISLSGGGTDEPLSPLTAPRLRGNTAKGSADIMPVVLGNSILFLQRHGRILREIAYSFADDSYVVPNLTIWSEHITGSGLVEMAYQREPDQVLWTVRNDGLSPFMIYERDQKVVGWGKIQTDGIIESMATIPGTNQTEVWAAVQRTIGGVVKRYVECFKDILWGTDQKDCFFVDSGLTYAGAPVQIISGLGHLEGKEVAILADGAVHPRRTVSGGQISLDLEAGKVQVGLPYSAIFKSVPLEAGAAEGTAQGKIKRIDQLTLRLYQTMGGKVGPDLDNLEALLYREPGDDMDAALPLFTGDRQIDFPGDYETAGQLYVVQDEPLPLTICALIPRLTTFDFEG